MNRLAWWEGLDKEQKYILLLAAIIPPPISLDILIAVSSVSAVKILNLVEKLVEKGIFSDYKSLGKGYYYFTKMDTMELVLKNSGEKNSKNVASRLINFLEKEYEEGPKKDLAIAHISQITGVKVEVPERVLRAAEYCLNQCEYFLNKYLTENTAVYFRLVIDNLSDHKLGLKEKGLYINAILGLVKVQGNLMPIGQQKNLLEKALQCAKQLKNLNLRARVNLVYAQILKTEGNYKKATHFFEAGWNFAKKLGNEELLKWVALVSTDFLFWEGRVAEAVERYEQVIGNLEELPSDEVTLRACACLGWCYGICGQTSRGIGLIDAVRDRAKKIGLDEIKPYVDLMSVLTLLEAGRIPEAEVYLKQILTFPEEVLGHYILWTANAAMAYVVYHQGDFEECFQYQQRSYEHGQKLGRFHHRGPWNFEYLYGLEKAGMVHPEMNYESEIKLFLSWPDIYMQGVSFRYKSQRALDNLAPKEEIYQDLKRSQELLSRAGAKLELSRTQLLLSRLLLQEGNQNEAKGLLDEAWKVLSAVNEEIFPNDLRKYVGEENREEVLIRTVVEVGNTLGSIRNQNELLQRTINLMMRFTRAERGGFFLVNENGNLNLVASRNLDFATISSPSFSINYNTIDEVIRLGKEIIKTGIASKKIYGNQTTQSGWMICSPVIMQDRILGVFYLDSSLIGIPFPENDVPILRAIGNQIATAVDNAIAYEEIVLLHDRLEEKNRIYSMEMGSPLQLQEIVGKSKEIQIVRRKIQNVSSTNSTVLITGETGVGKGVVAHAIHRLSARAAGPFIPVNMASFAPDLIASELFGHEKGAFTGAVKTRIGRFELADGGTFFLDDIDILPLDIQPRILRAIQEKEFERVGGTKTIISDFRLIAATNQNLKALMKSGRFRPDLYYRLNVFPIHIPPLRERKEDIPILATHFLEFYKVQLGKKLRGISQSEMKQLIEYDWPGNVRELMHIIERVVILSENQSLQLPSLKGFAHDDTGTEELVPLEEMERSYIMKVLEACAWKVSGNKGAARILNLKPTTLYSKIQRLGITKNVHYVSH